MNSITSEETAVRPVEQIPIWKLPKLVWVCGVLFSVNLLIAGAIAISPELKVDMYGVAVEPESTYVLTGTKPSPFVEPASQKPRPVRTAERLRPVMQIDSAVEAAMMMDMPARTAIAASAVQRVGWSSPVMPQRATNYVSGEKVYDAVEKASEYPRLSAAVAPKQETVKAVSDVELPLRRTTTN